MKKVEFLSMSYKSFKEYLEDIYKNKKKLNDNIDLDDKGFLISFIALNFIEDFFKNKENIILLPYIVTLLIDDISEFETINNKDKFVEMLFSKIKNILYYKDDEILKNCLIGIECYDILK